MNALYSLYDALIGIHVPSDKARAVVDAMEHDMMTALATKSDLAATQLLLAQQFDAARTALKQDIDALRIELKQEVGALRTELKQEVDALRTELKQDIGGLRTSGKLEMELLRYSMTVRLGSMLVVGLGVLFAALKLT